MRRVAGVLFVVTGASALIAEQAFEKLLEPLLGTTVHAAAAVLSIYFAGLTIGGWAYRFLRRTRLEPLRLYASLELGVGLWALMLYLAFERLTAAFLPLLRGVAGDFATLEAMRLAVASCWILPPTILMGATFPAMVDFISQWPDSRRAVTRFYALNLLGAAIAAGAAPYLLFAPFGLDKGMLAAASLDLAVGVIAWLSAPSSQRSAPPSLRAESREPRAYLLVLAAFASGLLFFALEVVWTHLIATVSGNSVYAFAAMLFAVLAGLFIGSTIASRLARGAESIPAALPAFAFIGGAALLAAQQMAWPYVPHLFTVVGPRLQSFAAGEAFRTLVALVLIVPVATVLGSVLPLLFRLREFPVVEQGRTAGAMTAANAVGCCAGALVAAFVLVPGVGSEASLLAIAIAYAVIGAGVLLPSPPRRRIAGLAFALVTLLISGLAPRWDRLRLTSGENVYFAPAFVGPESRLLFFHEDAAGGITTVVQNAKARVLLTNGKFQGSDAGETLAQIGLALVPALHVSRFDDALVIGLGTGQSALVAHGVGFARVNVAEIAPGMIAAARGWFPHVNGRVLEQPNVRTIVEDGRNVLQLRDKKYDMITMEISSMWFAGATNLYSRDFYRAAAARLRPGGVMQQWLQLHHLTTRELASAIGSMHSVFPYVTFWVVGGQGIVVGTMEPQVLRAEALARGMAVTEPGVMRLVLRDRVLAEDDVPRLLASVQAPINDDRNRWLEYRAPRYNLRRDDLAAKNLRALRSVARPAPLRAEPKARGLIGVILRAAPPPPR
jgi:spermidine synthase